VKKLRTFVQSVLLFIPTVGVFGILRQYMPALITSFCFNRVASLAGKNLLGLAPLSQTAADVGFGSD
jgi:hypothetical protein